MERKKALCNKVAAASLIVCMIGQSMAIPAFAYESPRVVYQNTTDTLRATASNGTSTEKQENLTPAKATASNAMIMNRKLPMPDDSILHYYSDSELIVNSGVGYEDASEDLDKIKDLDAFTMTMQFKTTSTSLQSLFFVGSDQPNTASNYFNLYITDKKVGMELRDGVTNPAIAANIALPTNTYHTITLSYLRGQYYTIYVDGNRILKYTNKADVDRFLNNLKVEPNTMTFGKGTRVNTNESGNYPFSGNIRDIQIFDRALSEKEIFAQHGMLDAVEEGTIISETDIQLNGTKPFDLSEQLDEIKNLTKGSINTRFRIDNYNKKDENRIISLFSISDNRVNDTYASFYLNLFSNEIGMEIKNKGITLLNNQHTLPDGYDLRNRNWHTATYTFNGGFYSIYLDGVLCLTGSSNASINSLTDANTISLGGVSKANNTASWKLKGNIGLIEVYDNPLLFEDEIKLLHNATLIDDMTQAELPETAIKSEPINLYTAGDEDSKAYRIPSILTTKKGTVIAAIDKRNTYDGDCGNIDTVIRRSFDNGLTWEDQQVLIDLPGLNDYNAAFAIDASMVEDEVTGEIHLLVDMFPESWGLMGNATDMPLQTGSGYREVGGIKYLELRDYESTNKSNTPKTEAIYTLRDDGSVYLENINGTSTITTYTVPEFHTGELFKDGVSAGNIFKYTDSGAFKSGELKVMRTSYLWMVTSKDDGVSWSNPVCITGQVKEDWMQFYGTGPGVGIQIENGEHKGRLVFPVYYTNSVVGTSQTCAVIYSDDHGKTWELGKTPNELRGINPETMNDKSKMLTESQVVEVGTNGRLKVFMRCNPYRTPNAKVYTATSDDGGASWSDLKVDRAIYEDYCQLSIIKYRGGQLNYNGKMQDAYVFSNPTSETIRRNDGAVRIGFYNEETDSFEWPYKQMVHTGSYQYSCLTSMANGEIGLFYEAGQDMRFTSFTTDWVSAPRTADPNAPLIKKISMEKSGTTVTFTVDFDQNMMVAGTPKLKIMLDNQEGAATYVSGDGTKQMEFTYDMKNFNGYTITAINVQGQGSSEIGNRINKLPANVSYSFKLKDQPVEKPNNKYDKESSSSTTKPAKTPASQGDAKNWEQTDKGWRMSNENGGYVTNEWKQVNGQWYFFGEDGYMASGWQMVDNKWYLLAVSGETTTNWQKVGDLWYFLNADGSMMNGWVLSDDKWYYLNSNGDMAANSAIDGYQLDSTGAWIQ